MPHSAITAQPSAESHHLVRWGNQDVGKLFRRNMSDALAIEFMEEQETFQMILLTVQI